jgi:hypothetical protein
MHRLLCPLSVLAIFVTACGDAPPPPAQVAAPRNVRVHVSNARRFDICRVEACGHVGRAIVEGAAPAVNPSGPPLKPHEAGLYELQACTGTLRATACPQPGEAAPCLKTEGGAVDDGTMFRVQPCAL